MTANNTRPLPVSVPREAILSRVMDRVQLLNIEIDSLSRFELLNRLKLGGVVFTPNLDHLSKLQSNPDFYYAYTGATYRVCDSQILFYASRFLGTPIKEKISGSDLLPSFCQFYRNDPSIKVFLLGGAPGVAKRARQRINAKVGRQMVVGTYSPSFGFEKNKAECDQIVELINRSDANVVAVGLGAPKQELWISKHKPMLPKVTTFLAIGAALDFEAGTKKRAPKWMSQCGLEWLHRLGSEPKRLWRRYFLEDIPILWLIIQQKFNRYQAPFEVNLRKRQMSTSKS